MNFPVLQASLKENQSGVHSNTASNALRPTKLQQRSSNSSNTSDVDVPVAGGVLKDGLHSWLARGSVLVIIQSKTNSVISTFDFNRMFTDLRFVITTCCSCDRLLLVGLKGQDGRGCVAVYHPLISKLMKAIDVPYPVSALEIVTSCGGAVASSHCLSKSLRWLFGIVAVGTEEGHLYLLDLRFDGSDVIEKLPSQIEIVPPAIRNVPRTRENIVRDNSFLAFEMQAACHEEGVFHYAKPDDEIIESFYPCDASVTTLLYEPRTAFLFVGFSFGHFQIFSLQDLSLVHSSDAQENLPPVLQFSFQEPENDPRKFCYLWVARGHKLGVVSPQGSSEPLTLSMFQLAFMKKEILSKTKLKNGVSKIEACARVLYKNLEHCGLRFEHSLGAGLISSMSKCHGSTLLMCSSVEKYSPEIDHRDSPEEDIEYYASPSTSFCMFGWQSPNLGKHKGRGELNVLVFDLNRWYMAQMPHSFRGDEEDFIYAGFWAFDNEKNSLKEDETILGMHVSSDKIHHFVSGMKPLPERYFLPSACTFSLHYITNFSLHHYDLFGYQQQVLNTISELKSLCLVNPKEIHDNILSAELYSKHSTNQAFTPDMMRENILTTGLEHGQVCFLLSVVRDLASGHLAACGCTLRFVMDWAWKSVAHVKDLIDRLCVPIFDCTCSILDALVHSQLQFYTTQIHHLKMIFRKLMEFTEDASDQSKDELQTKLNVVTLIYQYLKVVQWFISNGLLPEQLDNIDSDQEIITPSGILIYKYSRLRQVFDQRRSELSRSNAPDLLLIDGWVEEIGEPLTSRWLKEEGGKTTYPPPSFMTLLDMYYLDCVDVITKHCLVMYLLFDVLAMFSTLEGETKDSNQELYESQRERLNNIASFLHMFAVPPGLIKLTQGFWLLDHKNFEDALNVLLDADTSQRTAPWQERRILRAFLHQGHPAMALKYISTCHPHVETINDAKLHVSIFVQSREPLKAWNLVQMCAGQHDTNQLFSHLFLLCKEYSQLDQLLRLPFNDTGEEMIIKYLRESNSVEDTEILVLFYLQHSKYVEAIKLHSQNKHIRLMRDQSDESRRRSSKLDHIVQSYTNILPKIEREIALSSNKYLKQHSTVRKTVHKPSSLSAVVHPIKSREPASRAGRLVNFMDKMEEKKRNTQEPLMTPIRRRPQHGMVEHSFVNDSIFVYPRIDDSKKRRSTDIQGLLGRRSSFGSPARGSHLKMAQMPPLSVAGRRLSNMSVASMLLQTPPISRRRQSVSQQDMSLNLHTGSPHSILKVKLFKRDGSRSPSLSVISQASSHLVKTTTFPKDGDNVNAMDNEIKHEIPTISTPSAKIFKHFGLEQSSSGFDPHPSVKEHKQVFDTPKRLRFAGLDSSANDSGLSAVLSPPIEQVAGLPNLTPVQVEAFDSADENEMDVDVTGDESGEEEEDEDEEEVENDEDFPVKIQESNSVTHDILVEESENQNLEPVEISEDEEDVMSEDSEEELETSDEKNLDDRPFGQRLPICLPQDDDAVICLDSSSEDEQVMYEEKVVPYQNEDDKEEVETREAEQHQEEIVDRVIEEEHEYGSEEFSVDQDVSHEAEILAIVHESDVDEEIQKEILTTGGDVIQDDPEDVRENLPENEDEFGHINETESCEVCESPMVDDVLEVECKKDDVRLELSEDSDTIEENLSPELVVPNLENIQQGNLHLFISDDESDLEDAVPNDEDACETANQEVLQQVSSDAQQDDNVNLKLQLSSSEEELFEEGILTEEEKGKSGDSPAYDKTSATHQEESTSDYQSMSTTKIEEDVEPQEQDEFLDIKVTKEMEAVVTVFASITQKGGDSTKSDLQTISETVEKHTPEKAEVTGEETAFAAVVSECRVIINPSTPIMNRMKNEPTFVLSPPNTRRSTRKASKSTQYTPKPEALPETEFPKSPSRVTRRTSRQSTQETPVPEEPEFLFSPPKTRKRITRKLNEFMATLSPPPSMTKRTRSQDTAEIVKTPEQKPTPMTPSRRTRQSPGRKPPSTPTRSSSRVKAKLHLTKETEKTSESEAQLTDEPTANMSVKRTRRRKTSVSSDMRSSDSEVPTTPSRRSSRRPVKAKVWSPRQDKTKFIELTPLHEEEAESKTIKRRKTKEESSEVSSRSNRSSTYATRTRRKAKIFTLEQK